MQLGEVYPVVVLSFFYPAVLKNDTVNFALCNLALNPVSVPLRGKYRGEYGYLAAINHFVKLFPSPCGVNIVANYTYGNSSILV